MFYELLLIFILQANSVILDVLQIRQLVPSTSFSFYYSLPSNYSVLLNLS